jgi:protein Mpv17
MARPWDRYIFNTVPLPHILLLTFLLGVIVRIGYSYHLHFEARPVLTLCVISCLLASVSDTLAQMVELIRARRQARKTRDEGLLNGDIEMKDDVGTRTPSPRLANFSGERFVPYDQARMVRFMGYGFFFAPISVCPRWA